MWAGGDLLGSLGMQVRGVQALLPVLSALLALQVSLGPLLHLERYGVFLIHRYRRFLLPLRFLLAVLGLM